MSATAAGDSIAELELLEARQAELLHEQHGIERGRGELDREHAELSERALTSTSVDELRNFETRITEIGVWQRVFENSAPAITSELRNVGTQIAEVRRRANRHRVATLILEANAVFDKILMGIDELAEVRRRAVEAGAPTTLLSPPKEADPIEVERFPHSDVATFLFVDRLGAQLRGPWAAEIVPAARQDLL